MRSATLTSSSGGAFFAKASSQRIGLLRDIERGEIGDEAVFVVEAAQVEDQGLVLDAADHRNRQPAQSPWTARQADARLPWRRAA